MKTTTFQAGELIGAKAVLPGCTNSCLILPRVLHDPQSVSLTGFPKVPAQIAVHIQPVSLYLGRLYNLNVGRSGITRPITQLTVQVGTLEQPEHLIQTTLLG